jgi:5-methylcytosine-specific restriction protein A
MEAHHLIQTSNAEKYYRSGAGVNIDCLPNLVCLCPTCHKAIHLGNDIEREGRGKKLFAKKGKGLQQIIPTLTEAEILELYDL